MARPTKYTDETIEKSIEYIEGGFLEKEQIIPSVEGLAEYLGCGVRTLQDWSNQEEKAEFSRTLEALKAKQARILLNNGLSGAFNPTITKLALSNHGYSEKTQTELTGKDGGALEVRSNLKGEDRELLDRFINQN